MCLVDTKVIPRGKRLWADSQVFSLPWGKHTGPLTADKQGEDGKYLHLGSFTPYSQFYFQGMPVNLWLCVLTQFSEMALLTARFQFWKEITQFIWFLRSCRNLYCIIYILNLALPTLLISESRKLISGQKQGVYLSHGVIPSSKFSGGSTRNSRHVGGTEMLSRLRTSRRKTKGVTGSRNWNIIIVFQPEETCQAFLRYSGPESILTIPFLSSHDVSKKF